MSTKRLVWIPSSWLLYGVSVAVVAACGQTTNSQSSESTQSETEVVTTCVGACENDEWPRLILGVVETAEVPQFENATLAYSELVNEVSEAEGDVDGCGYTHSRAQRLNCRLQWFVRPGVEAVTLTVSMTSGQSFVKELELAPHNYCGRQIAYVVATMESSGVSWSDVSYVSPCNWIPTNLDNE
jgi:hypothetical protein